MPYRQHLREQDWLLPPSLGELIADDHPVRFVAEFVDMLDWDELGISVVPAVEGAPSYPPQVLIAIWLYGFMVRVRSSRKLERSCAENIPMMWLAGRLRPDHSTLARFYQANRKVMRKLFKRTVHLAMQVGLVDFALQAIDGTRMGAAGRATPKSRQAIDELLKAVEAEITAMEAAHQREDGPDGQPPPGPRAKLGKEQLRDRLKQALAELDERQTEPGRHDAKDVSITDPEANWIKAAQGMVVGYNAQAVVDSKAQIVVAAEVTDCGSDGEQLLPMLAEARAMTGRNAARVAADSGYFDIAAVAEAQTAGIDTYVPQAKKRVQAQEKDPYSKAHFTYNVEVDAYVCPEGKFLPHWYSEHENHGKPMEVRVYRGHDCQGCPAQIKGACTETDGRRVRRFPYDAALPPHLEKMKSEPGRAVSRQRSAVVEPLFADTKEHMDMRRFLLRGLANVKGEWWLTCTAHNLRKLWRHWWRPRRLAGLCPG